MIVEIGLVLAAVVSLAGGFALGKSHERNEWRQRGKQIIAGQRVWVKGMGEVFVLGYNKDGSLVDLVPEDFLQGKWPSAFTNEELDAQTFSIPTDQFLTQVPEVAVKKAARERFDPPADRNVH